MTGCWVTHCTDLSAGFATYKRVSVEEGEREWYFFVENCLKT